MRFQGRATFVGVDIIERSSWTPASQAIRVLVFQWQESLSKLPSMLAITVSISNFFAPIKSVSFRPRRQCFRVLSLHFGSTERLHAVRKTTRKIAGDGNRA